MALTIDSFLNLAQQIKDKAMALPSADDTTIRLEDGKLTTGEWMRLGTRTDEFKADNRRLRSELYDALRAEFGNLAKLPQKVKDALKLNDFLVKDDAVTSSRPLTARRIVAIANAVIAQRKEYVASLPNAIKTRGAVRNFSEKAADRLFVDVSDVNLKVFSAVGDLPKDHILQRKFTDLYQNVLENVLSRLTAFVDAFDAVNPDADIPYEDTQALVERVVNDVVKNGFNPKTGELSNFAYTINSLADLATGLPGELPMLTSLTRPIKEGTSLKGLYEHLMVSIDAFKVRIEGARLPEGKGKLESYSTTLNRYLIARFSMPSAAALKKIMPDRPNDITLNMDDMKGDTSVLAATGERDHVRNLVLDMRRNQQEGFRLKLGDGEEQSWKHLQEKDEDDAALLEAANDVVSQLKAYLGKTDDADPQLHVVANGLTQIGMGLPKSLGYGGITPEHTGVAYHLEKLENGDVKLSATLDPVERKNADGKILENMSFAYVVKPDGSSNLVDFAYTSKPLAA